MGPGAPARSALECGVTQERRFVAHENSGRPNAAETFGAPQDDPVRRAAVVAVAGRKPAGNHDRICRASNIGPLRFRDLRGLVRKLGLILPLTDCYHPWWLRFLRLFFAQRKQRSQRSDTSAAFFHDLMATHEDDMFL